MRRLSSSLYASDGKTEANLFKSGAYLPHRGDKLFIQRENFITHKYKIAKCKA